MISPKQRIAVAILFVVVAPATMADTGRFAVTPKASTLGLGGDVSFRLAERIGVRVMGQQLGYDTSGTVDGVDYDADLDLQSFGAVVDLFPSRGRFRFSAGLLANGNELSTIARLDPTASYGIGLDSFTGAELGRIDGTVTFAPVALVAGVGWGNPFSRSGRLTFSADLGIAHQPIDSAELQAENPFGNPLLDQEMQEEERRFENDVERLEFYPVVSLGLSIRL